MRISRNDQMAARRSMTRARELVRELVQKEPPVWTLDEVLGDDLQGLARLELLLMLARAAVGEYRASWWDVRQVRLAHVVHQTLGAVVRVRSDRDQVREVLDEAREATGGGSG